MVGEWEPGLFNLVEVRSRISSRMEIMIGKAHLLIVTRTTLNITAYFEKIPSKISTRVCLCPVRGVVRRTPSRGKVPRNEAALYRGHPKGTREHGYVYSRQLVLFKIFTFNIFVEHYYLFFIARVSANKD